MNLSQKVFNIIREEIVSVISEDWERIELTIHIAVKDTSLAIKGIYITPDGINKHLESYGNGWDLGDALREWYESDHKSLEPQYRWNKIQFEIDKEGYAAVTTWDQEYYDRVYPNG